jgi:RNA-binding protein YhbY
MDARAAARAITDRLPDVHVTQVIGRTIVLYKPFDEDPRIRLPD